MEKEFVPYELALRLKELGFDEPCFAQFYKYPTQEKEEFRLFQDCVWENRTTSYWRTNISSHFVSAPTFSQAFRWFREKYNIHIRIEKYDETKWWANWGSWTSEVYETYEEAEFAHLEKLIEIVEQKQT